MKRALLLMLLFSVAWVGCDVLEQEPQAEISDENAFNNAKGAQAALAGLYDQLQDDFYYGRQLQIIGDVSSDIAQSIGTWDFYREMDTYQVGTTNLEVRNFWTQGYAAINQANNLIEAVPGIENMGEEAKDEMLGQAYFVRALAFFDLARAFGGVPGEVGSLGVPLVTAPSRQIDETSHPERASLADTYAQVERDLEQALERLPGTYGADQTDRSQAVTATAQALLARLHLYLKSYADAARQATLVIENPRYALVENYADIFSNNFTTESIFELSYNSTDQSSLRYWYAPGKIGGRGELAAHASLYEQISASGQDERAGLYAYSEEEGAWYPTKYSKTDASDHAHVLRIAEMYLIRAEARANTGDLEGALADVNAVRARAGLDAFAAETQAQVLSEIYEQEKFEFAFEGHRWFDLIRTGRALTVLASVPRTNAPGAPATLTNPGRQLLPIPQADMDANENIVQNEAYR